MSVTTPSSTACRTASCCALLKRWISSMKRMVRAAERARASRAPLIAARTSAVPEDTADSCASRAPVSAAMTRASVVLPQPGRPPEDHREESRRARSPRAAPCRTDDVVLTDELGERARPQARRERRLGRLVFVGQREEVHRSSSRQCSAVPVRRPISATIAGDAEGARPQHHLRAAERVLGATRPGAAAQGQGRGPRTVGGGVPLRARRLPRASRHPPARPTCTCRDARRCASRAAPCSPATVIAASTAAATATSPSTTSCRAPRAASTRGTTS